MKFSQYNIEIEKNEQFVVLYNTYKGSAIKIDFDTYQSLMEDMDYDHPYFETLRTNGFIVSDEVDEYAKVQHELSLDINNPMDKALNVVIAPTMRCQLKCYYCYEQRAPLSTTNMTASTCDNVVSFIKVGIKPHTETINICWFGGEPLLDMKSILKIGSEVKRGLRDGIIFNSRIITNGILLTKENCMALVNECNLNNAQITLDGKEEQHCKAKGCKKEAYQQVLKNIVDCASLIRLSICYNLSKDNYCDLEPVMQYLLVDNNLLNKIDIHLVRVKPYSNDCGLEAKCFTEEEFDKIRISFDAFLKTLGQTPKSSTVKRASPCSLLKNSGAVIDPEGYLYKCEHLLGQKEKASGDVVNGWYFNQQHMNAQKVIWDNQCSKCAYYPRCGFALCQELRAMGRKDDGNCSYTTVIENRIKNSIFNKSTGKGEQK